MLDTTTGELRAVLDTAAARHHTIRMFGAGASGRRLFDQLLQNTCFASRFPPAHAHVAREPSSCIVGCTRRPGGDGGQLAPGRLQGDCAGRSSRLGTPSDSDARAMAVAPQGSAQGGGGGGDEHGTRITLRHVGF